MTDQQQRTGVEVEAARSSVGSTSMPSTVLGVPVMVTPQMPEGVIGIGTIPSRPPVEAIRSEATRARLDEGRSHKPATRGSNPRPATTPIEATAAVVLVWRGHRLRARSWHDFMVVQIEAGRPVTVAHERTACGIDLQDHIVTPIEIDGEVTCRGCAGYMRPARRVLPDRTSEGIAA